MHAIEIIVPTCDPKDSVLKYVNPRVNKLYKIKSKLITDYNNLRKKGLHGRTPIIKEVKASIRKIKNFIKEEFAKAATKYWTKQIKIIDYRNPEAFFPKINKILRSKQSIGIEFLAIHEEDSNLLEKSEIIEENLPVKDNKFIINEPIDEMNLMGVYYEKINFPRPLNRGSNIEYLVDKYFKNFEDEFNQQIKDDMKLTRFSDTNTTQAPDTQTTQNYFCNTGIVTNILKDVL